jgi:hypothetical protein
MSEVYVFKCKDRSGYLGDLSRPKDLERSYGHVVEIENAQTFQFQDLAGWKDTLRKMGAYADGLIPVPVKVTRTIEEISPDEQFVKWYYESEANYLHCQADTRFAEDLLSWLKQHKEKVIEILYES